MDYKQLEDKELVKLYQSGNEEAFETLLNRYKDKIYHYIFFAVSHDHDLANDLFQDTFIKVIRTLKAGNYNEEGKFISWTMRIAHNLVIDHFRKSGKMPTFKPKDQEFDIFSLLPAEKGYDKENMQTVQTRTEVRDLIRKLPEEQMQVLMMRFYYDMSFKEIADSTNVSINTALGRMRYALINLRKMVENTDLAFSF